MKLIMKHTSLITLLTGLLGICLWACGPENDILRNQVPAVGARVKFIHAVPGGPSVNIFANDAKLNGAAVVYGGAFPVAEYSALTPGTVNLKVATPASGTTASQPILSAPVTLEADKYYTIAAAGTPTAPAAVLINDDISLPDPSKAYFRVINLLTSGQTVDLAIGTGSPLLSAVASRTASAFVAVDPVTSTSPYTFQVRIAGVATPLSITNQTAGVGRKYTIFVRGTLGSAGVPVPAASVYLTR